MRKTNRILVLVRNDHMAKIESVKRQQGFKKDADAIRFMIDKFSPLCQCGEKAKEIVINGKARFICEDCLELKRPVSFTKKQWDEA